MMKQWRLILDSKKDGFYNMAADEAILLHFPYQRIPTLRIYRWRRPCVSIGCYQKAEEVLASGNVPFVRRITGGAAILHDEEVTYSIVCSSSDLALQGRVKDSYKTLCSFLREFYLQLGIKVRFAQDIFSTPRGRHINYCYAGLEEFDLVINGKKIGGNAQRRKKDIIFQQGTIPQKINFSLLRSWIKGAEDIEKRATFLDEIINTEDKSYRNLSLLLADSFQKAFAVRLIKADLYDEEKGLCGDLVKNKYSRDEWNFYKNSRCIALRDN